MAQYDLADILSRCKRLLNRPSTDEAFTVSATDDVWYGYIGDAEKRVNQLVAWHCPEAAYEPPVLLTTSDSGATYTFGTDSDSNPIVPLGQIELRASATGVFLVPGNDWDDTTDVYLLDTNSSGHTVIRFPGQRTRTFASGPYCRYVKQTRAITSSASEITLKPYILRELIPYDAARQGAVRLGIDPSEFEKRFDERWYELLANLKTQQHGQGLRAFSGGPSVWWRSADLGRR